MWEKTGYLSEKTKAYTAGVDKVITTHIHSEKILEYYAKAYNVDDGKKVLKNLSLESILADYLLHKSSLVHKNKKYLANKGEKIVFIATDSVLTCICWHSTI